MRWGFSVKAFHIRRVEYDAINRTIRIRQIPTIDTHGYIGRFYVIEALWHISPKNTLAPSDIGNNRAFGNV